jgi:hypothetical protein
MIPLSLAVFAATVGTKAETVNRMDKTTDGRVNLELGWWDRIDKLTTE